MTLLVAPLDPVALNGLADALTGAALPVADLGEPGRVFFRFDDDAGLAGFGGLEGDGPDRLVRSILVAPDRRGDRLGSVIVALLENEARGLGVDRLHLLTTTAAPFFRSAGYVDADRAAVPSAVANSREFTALCPASAAYLVKVL